MLLKQQVANLLDQEMDRKTFLKTAGIAALALSGATVALKSLTQVPLSQKKATSALSYGGSAYGGKKQG